MKHLYVVIEHDRHRDPQPYVFDSPVEAIGFAQGIARDWLNEVEEPADDYLYAAIHPYESDAVWVVEKTLNDWEGRL